LRRPTECNAVRADDLVAAAENLCIVRANLCNAVGLDVTPSGGSKAMENNHTQVFVVAAVVSSGMKGKVLSLIVN
jgi:hypothetical protein